MCKIEIKRRFVWFENKNHFIKKNFSNIVQDKAHADRAIYHYTKALKIQPKNMWAANGIGGFNFEKIDIEVYW